MRILRQIILTLFVFTSSDTFSQTEKKTQSTRPKELLGEWFVNNKDSCFFTSDTLIFIKRTNREKRDDIKIEKRDFLEPRTELVKSTEFANLEFKKSKKVEFGESHYGGYLNESWGIQIKWSLKSDTLRLSSDKFVWTFKVISKGTISFEHLFSNTPKNEYETLTTQTITFKRVK